MSQTKIEIKEIEVEGHSDISVVKFVGDLDATNIEYTVDKVFNIMNNKSANIIADFSELRYVNSTGIGILFHFSKSAQSAGGFFKICNINDNVLEIMTIIGATNLLETYETLDKAISSIN